VPTDPPLSDLAFKLLVADEPLHPQLGRLAVFPRVNPARIALLLRAVDGNHDGREGGRWRLFWYAVAARVRSIGYAAGVAFVCILVLGITAALIIAPTPLSGLIDERTFITVLFTSLGASGLVWFYLYFLVGRFAPSTRFALLVRVVAKQSGVGQGGLSRSGAIVTLDSVGKLARVFFRVVTRRTLNVGVRPDLADDVAALAQSIMLAVPPGGVDDLRRYGTELRAYRTFLQDVVGLLVVERLDVIPALVEAQPAGLLLRGEVGEPMRLYLQPLARRSPIEAVAEFGMPAAALVLSVVALVVSIATGASAGAP
jgi:hypothetical protein